MAAPRIAETSVLFSLHELRQIEQTRVAEERAVVRDAELAAVRARQDEARIARETEEARVQAERDEVVRIAEAQAEAERQLRLRVEATELAERARHQAALDAERLHSELALRRAEVAKKRPTWMIAVTGFAVVAAGALIWFAVQSQHASDASDRERIIALEAKDKALAEARDAAAQLDRVQRELDALEVRVNKAVHDVVVAGDAAARQLAQRELLKLQAEEAATRAKVAEAKRIQDKIDRNKILKLDDDCVNNSLSKKCLKQ